MCIFSGDVENVKNTKIFVAPCSRRTTQLTVYSNQVSLKNEGFMVLPFPGKFVKFVDLTERKELFKDLEEYFPKSRTKSLSYSYESKLEQVGSYQAVAMSDFKELSMTSKKLNIDLDPEVLSFLEKHYSSGFGFVVFRLMKEMEYHPFGYVHTTDTGKMFVPTMHYHSRTGEGPSDKQVTADWHHKIYLLNRELNTGMVRIRNFKVPVSENVFDFRSLPGDLELPQYLTKYEIRGNSFPNMDLEC